MKTEILVVKELLPKTGKVGNISMGGWIHAQANVDSLAYIKYTTVFFQGNTQHMPPT